MLATATLLAGLATAASAQPTSSELVRCQKRLERRTRAYAKLISTKIHGCTEKVVACKLAQEIDAVDPTACLASANTYCSAVPTLLAEKRSLAAMKMSERCKPPLAPSIATVADLEPFVKSLGFDDVTEGGTGKCATLGTPPGAVAVTDVDTLVECLLRITECDAQRAVFVSDPRAEDSLTEVGLNSTFPCVAP